MKALERLGRAAARAHDDVADAMDVRETVRTRLFDEDGRRRGRRPSFALSWRRLSLAMGTAGALACAAWLIVAQPLSALDFEVGARRPGAVGEVLTSPAGTTLPLSFSDGTELLLTPQTSARVLHVDNRGARVAVEKGQMAVDVPQRRRKRWTFHAGPFLVEVHGTRFDLAWSPSEGTMRLSMREGRVLASGGALGAGVPVVAPDVLVAEAASGRFHVEKGPVHRPQIQAQASREAEAPGEEPSALPEPVSAAKPAQEARPRPRPAAVSRAVSSWQVLASERRYGEALSVLDRGGYGKALAAASAADLLVISDVARFGGAPQKARLALQTLRKRFPRDERATVAAFSLGRLAFDVAHDFAAAARWFEVYLAAHPDGPLAREAAGRLMESWQRAGQSGRARERATDYLRRYPSGPHAPLARSIIGR